MLIKFDAKFVKLMRNRQDILAELTLMLKLIHIQIVILRKVINDVADNFYKKLNKFIKFLIKEFKTRD